MDMSESDQATALTVAQIEAEIQEQKSSLVSIQEILSNEQQRLTANVTGLAFSLVAWLIIIPYIVWSTGVPNSQRSGSLDVLIVFGGIANFFWMIKLLKRFFNAKQQVAKWEAEEDAQQTILYRLGSEMTNRIECKKLLALHRVHLKQISYDIQALENLIDEGITPQELKQTIEAILTPSQEQEMTLEKQTAEAQEVEQMSVADFEAKQKYRDKILEALKKREQEIQQRIESGNLTQDDGTILLEAARRDINQKLQALDQA